MVWLKFILCFIIIFLCEKRIAKYGNIIAHKTGLSGIWTGLVLLALVTSLPELFTGISAVTLVNAPDLTIGNLFGANAFNLLNLALLDIVCQNGSLLRGSSQPMIKAIEVHAGTLGYISSSKSWMHLYPMRYHHS